MQSTSVTIRKIEKEDSRMKGIASVLLDDEFAVHDIRIIEGSKAWIFILFGLEANVAPDFISSS